MLASAPCAPPATFLSPLPPQPRPWRLQPVKGAPGWRGRVHQEMVLGWWGKGVGMLAWPVPWLAPLWYEGGQVR